MANDENLSKAMVEVIGKAGAYDALTSLGEDAIDRVLEEGVLKEVPIVKTIIGLYRAGIGIKEVIFLRKIRGFLTRLQDVPQEKREQFVANMDANPELRAKVGAQLILLLEKMDELSKPALLGQAFGSYMKGDISLEEFQRMGRVIDRCFLDDLRLWLLNQEQAQRSGLGALDLESCGLIEEYDIGDTRSPYTYYKWTHFGQKFCKLVLVPLWVKQGAK